MNDRGGRIELEVKSEILPFHFSEPESKRVNEVKEACSGLFPFNIQQIISRSPSSYR